MSDNLTIFYQNTRGLKTKANDLFENVASFDFHIYCLTETFFNPGDFDTDHFPDSYIVHRSDRTTHGGGVLTAVSRSIKCFRRNDLESDFEAVWLEFFLPGNRKLLLGNVYLCPALPVFRYDQLSMFLKSKLLSFDGDIIFLGDFNVGKVDWPQCTAGNPLASDL